MLNKSDGTLLTDADFAELEAEAEQQGELLERELEFGADVYYPRVLGQLCDRYLDLRKGLAIRIRNGGLSQPLVLKKEHEETEPVVAKFYLSGGSRVVTPTVSEVNPDYEEITGYNYLYHLPKMTEFEIWQSDSPALVLYVMADQDYFRTFDTDDGTLPRCLEYLMQESERFHQPLGKISPEMIRVIQQILHCPYEDSAQPLYLESKAIELLALQFACLETDLFAPQQTFLKKSDRDRIYQAQQILIDNLNNPPSLKDLAQQVGLNDFKLKCGFREVFGQSAFKYLRDYRLEQARQLLTEGEMNVTEVALRVGFANRSYFAVAFRNKFGVNPKQYIKNHR
ncbi:MAG: AraC family transcriptional regulator [Cyanobacteria bacterium P01_G01_bin.19]